jgi:DNA-binding transcriptional MerR regulator
MTAVALDGVTAVALIDESGMPESESDDGYTIDDLAAVSRVPSRTIRFYQSKGALQSPKIKGRVAYYGPEHLERLKLIASLQDRGLRMDAIRELVSRIDKGELDVNEWLGIEQQLQASWANDTPRTASEHELYELAGTRRAGLIADLVRTKLVTRHGDTYFVRSPALLHVAMKLENAGVDLETAAEGGEILRKHLSRAASDLADYFIKHARDGFEVHGHAHDMATVMSALRPMGMEAVRVIFGQEMERVLRKMVESGKTAAISGRGRKR